RQRPDPECQKERAAPPACGDAASGDHRGAGVERCSPRAAATSSSRATTTVMPALCRVPRQLSWSGDIMPAGIVATAARRILPVLVVLHHGADQDRPGEIRARTACRSSPTMHAAASVRERPIPAADTRRRPRRISIPATGLTLVAVLLGLGR